METSEASASNTEPAADAADASDASDATEAADSAAADASAAAEESATVTSERVSVRRTPRYYRFMLAGVILFAIVAFILTVTFPQSADYDRVQVFGFLLLAAIVVGIALGALVALLAEAATRRKAKTIVADRLDVRQASEESDAPGETSGTQNSTES